MRSDRAFSYVVFGLFSAELLLVFVSWLLSATGSGDVRSLISAEGIRWLCGQFTASLLSPLLAWLLLLSMALGCLWRCGIVGRLSAPSAPWRFRDRLAFWSVLALLLAYVSVVLLLTVAPHAVLLSATGHLLSSPFSRAFVPIVAFGVLLASASYGLLSGRFATLADVVDSLSFGIAKAAPLFLLYVLLIQFYESLRFVFL